MDHGKFWSHVYHQKELCELIFSLLSGLPKPISLFYHSLSQKKITPPTVVLACVQRVVSILIDFFIRIANHYQGPDHISRPYYDRILAAKRVLRAEFIFDLIGFSFFNGPKENPKLSHLLFLINQKHPEVRNEIEKMVSFLVKDMQNVQRNLIRMSTGTDSILDKEGEYRERSEQLWKSIEHGWIINKLLEVFNIEYLDIFVREGGHYLLVNALLLISNKLVKWEQLYQDGLVTPSLALYMANMSGKQLQQVLKNGLVRREEYAERDFANIRIFSSKAVCEFIERVSRFETIPRQILTKDGNLIGKYETAPILMKLIKKFNLRKVIEDLGPECIQADRKEVLKSIMASLAGQAPAEQKQDDEARPAPDQQEMDPEVLELAQQFFNVDLSTISEVVSSYRGNRNKIRDMLSMEQYKPKKEERKAKVKKDEDYFKTYKMLVQKKYILPEGQGSKKRKKHKRNMLLEEDDESLETDADMKAKVLELTYQGSYKMYEDDYDESKHSYRVTGLIQQKKQEVKESDSDEDKFEDQQIGEIDQAEQNTEQRYRPPVETFPEDDANSRYYEPRAEPPKQSEQQIKSYGDQWVIEGDFPQQQQQYPPQHYHNDAKSANQKKWEAHHEKHFFHHNRKPDRGGAGRGRGKGRGGGGRKQDSQREFDSGYGNLGGEYGNKPKYVKKQ